MGPIHHRLAGKTIHAFDSFVGLPASRLQGDVDAPMVQTGVWGQGRCAHLGLAEIETRMSSIIPQDRIVFHPGWFEDSLPRVDPRIKYCFVNVDCDLYESTRTVLNELFGLGRLSDGCVLLFDDYLENRSSKKLGQRKAWEECKTIYKPDLTDLGPYGLSGWRFIYHAP